MRRLPPNQVAKSLAGVGQLIEDEDFKQQLFDQVDQPLGKSLIKTTIVSVTAKLQCFD